MTEFFESLRVGIPRRWRGGMAAALTALGAVWLLTEVATFVSEQAKATLQGHP